MRTKALTNAARTKKNPDPVTTFAQLASGVASALQVNEMLKKKKPARRKKRNPVQRSAVGGRRSVKANPIISKESAKNARVRFSEILSQVRDYPSRDVVGSASSLIGYFAATPAARKAAAKRLNAAIAVGRKKHPAASGAAITVRNPAKAKAPAANPRRRVTVPAKGDYYLLTIGSGDDIMAVYLRDGDRDGYSKRFKSLAAAKAYATKNRLKLKANPVKLSAVSGRRSAKVNPKPKAESRKPRKTNGIVSRTLARRKAGKYYRKELSLKRQMERVREMRERYEREAKENPAKLPAGFKWERSGKIFAIIFQGSVVAAGDTKTEALRFLKMYGPKARAQRGVKASQSLAKAIRTAARSINPKSAIRNPKSAAPRSRTYEMFQGRKPTGVKRMQVSEHAPARVAQLGDLVEIKLVGQPPIKFNPGRVKLAAAHGRLWIVGKRFARPDASQPATVVNPVGEIDHVVYGTRKPHHGDHAYTHYIHKLGEESGRRPLLCVDRLGFPVIRGGNYKIEARGIVD